MEAVASHSTVRPLHRAGTERGLSPVLQEPETRYPVNEAEEGSRMLHNDNISLWRFI